MENQAINPRLIMLKSKYDNVEDIPEGMEAAYIKTEDDKYQLLEVEGMVSKSKLDEFRTNNRELTKKLVTKDDEYNQFKQQSAEDLLKQQGDIDGLKTHLKELSDKEMSKVLEAHKAELAPLQAQVETLTIDSVIDSYSDKNVKTGLGSGFKMEVKSKVSMLDGKPVVDGVPLADYLGKAKEDKAFEAYLLAPGLSGAGSQASSSHSPSKTQDKLSTTDKIAKGLGDS